MSNLNYIYVHYLFIYFQVLATFLIIPVILLIITLRSYWYFSYPAMCTGSEVADYLNSYTSSFSFPTCIVSQFVDYLTPWISFYERRPCFLDISYIPYPEYHWFSNIMRGYITILCVYGLLIVLYALKIHKQSVSGPMSIFTVVKQMMIWHAVFLIVGLLFNYYLRTLTYSPDLRHTVRSILKPSMSGYNHPFFLWRDAWDYTMGAGCCGLDGYQDYIKLNMSIPAACQTEELHPCAKTVSVAGKKTFATGCVDAVMLHIIETEERRTFAFLWLIIFNVIIVMSTVCAIKKFCLIKKKQ